ncbi:MAG: phosphatidylglycerophosphatase A [Candidatus Omnitrophica bacterium]|nr:phosphatidylglycerophosphatase A [Candidatus Omnitrophota bacterium]
MNKLSFKEKFIIIISSMFGIGYIKLFSGSWACILAVLFFIFLSKKVFFIFTLISLILAFLFSSKAEKIFGQKDCKKIVIDDFAGMLVSFLFLPKDIRFIIFGFFLFRAIDFLKVPPADRLEEYTGSIGVVGDDLVASIYTNIILQLLKVAINIVS